MICHICQTPISGEPERTVSGEPAHEGCLTPDEPAEFIAYNPEEDGGVGVYRYSESRDTWYRFEMLEAEP